MLIGVVFGGLFSGVFTATESGAVGAAASFVVAAANRTLTLRTAWNAIAEASYTTASIFVITIGANLLTRFLSLSDVAAQLSELVLSFGAEPWAIAMGLVVLYVLLGLILEPMGALLLTLPVMLPVMIASDASMIWYGILIVKLLEVGMITPPVGLNVFVVKSVVGDRVSTAAIFRGIWWFLIIDFVVIGLMILFPSLVTAIPTLAGS